MRDMFVGEVIPFNIIIEELESLENKLNKIGTE